MGWIIGKGIGIPFRIGSSSSWSAYCTPLNLVLTEIIGGVRLTWEQDAKCTTEDGFEIWISIDGAAYVLLDTVLADVVTYDDMTDYAGSTIEYKVRAYKGTVYSEYSAEAEITIEAEITNLAVTWAEDHAVLTWDEQAGWDTEIYSSRDNVNWTLDETVTTGTETTINHCWQGTTVYFRARAKDGTDFGPYCSSINIVTPLVFKYDCNPTATLAFSQAMGLPAGKTVKVSWGSFNGAVEYFDNYTTTQIPTHGYLGAGEGTQDPCYVKLSGDLDSITVLYLAALTSCYGDLGKWVLPSGLISLRLHQSAFSGDISNWVLPPLLTTLTLYRNTFSGDLSSWSIATTASTIMYLEDTDGKNEFIGIPRGNCHQCEASSAGLYMNDCAVLTAGIDAWLAWFNTFLVTNTPVRNSLFMLNGTGMGVPTGGDTNANRLGIIAKYTAAGFTATITNNT